MEISDDDAKKLIEHIEKTVREIGKGNPRVIELINQWRSNVDVGLEVKRSISVRRSAGLDAPEYTPVKTGSIKTSFIGREVYTEIQKLDMLIYTLGIIFIAPKMMAEKFLNTIENYNDKKQIDGIHMTRVGESEDIERKPDISREIISQTHEKINELRKILEEIVIDAKISSIYFKKKIEQTDKEETKNAISE